MTATDLLGDDRFGAEARRRSASFGDHDGAHLAAGLDLVNVGVCWERSAGAPRLDQLGWVCLDPAKQ